MSVETLHNGKSAELRAQEETTVILETNQIPDSYCFTVRNRQLWSEQYHCFVREKIARDNHIGQLEYQAFSFIEQWVDQNDQGVLAWVSPPSPEVYPVSKIIISEIETKGGQKQLFNRAMIFDLDAKKCLKFAQDLTNYSQNRPLLSHLDEVRSTPLILNTQNISWIHILEELIDDPKLWQMVKTGEDQRIKEETLVQVRAVYQRLYDHSLPAEDAAIMLGEMRGNKPDSCPVTFKTGTAFQICCCSSMLIGSSFESDQYGSLEFECQKCNKVNRRPKGELIGNCQHCHADVTC